MSNNVNNKKIFSENLQYYLTKAAKTQKEIADTLGVPKSTVNAWVKAKKYPRIDKIEKLADYFGITKSDLIEKRNEEREKKEKNNDMIENVVVRMKKDADFLYVVKMIDNLDAEKYNSIKSLLVAFLAT